MLRPHSNDYCYSVRTGDSLALGWKFSWEDPWTKTKDELMRRMSRLSDAKLFCTLICLARLGTRPHGLALTWWECCGICL